MIRIGVTLLPLAVAALAAARADEFKPLFPADGIPKGWLVRAWSDIS